jgi:hypothetical protein
VRVHACVDVSVCAHIRASIRACVHASAVWLEHPGLQPLEHYFGLDCLSNESASVGGGTRVQL